MRTSRQVTLRLPGDGARFAVVGSGRDANLASVAATGGAYEEHLLALWPRIVAPDSVVLDAGANVGLHTLALAHLAPRGRVYAFEPSSATFAFLEENLAANGVGNVAAARAALGATAGLTTLSMNPDAPGGAFVSDALILHDTEPVEVVTLDEWAAATGLERLDVVKLDVEGSEPDVLDGGRATFERHRPDLVVELNPMALRRVAGVAPARFLERLAALYPTVAVVGRGGEPRLVDGWPRLEAHLVRHGIADLWCTARPVVARRLGRARGRGTFHFDPAYDLELEVGGATLTVAAGSVTTLAGCLTNRSAHTLSPTDPAGEVVLSYHWLTPAGEPVEFEGRRTPLPHPVRPGKSAGVAVEVEAPAGPGDYVLEVTLLQEGVAWLHHLDPSLALRLPATVT